MRLERATFGRHAFDPATFLYYAASDRAGFLVAEAAGRLAGYIVARRTELRRTVGEIPSIAVRPELRDQGVGSLLLRQGITHLAAKGVTIVHLQVAVGNERAIALYRRLGFRPARRLTNYYGRGEDALEMELALAGREEQT